MTNDGDFLILGISDSYGIGDDDIVVIKTNLDGDSLWTKTYGDRFSEFADNIYLTENEGFIISGTTEPFGDGDMRYWFINADSLGDTLWTFRASESTAFLGIGENSAFQTNRGEYLLSTQAANSVDIRGDLELIKLSTDQYAILSVDTVYASSDSLIRIPIYFQSNIDTQVDSLTLKLTGYAEFLSFQGIDTTSSILGNISWDYLTSHTDSGLVIALAGDSSVIPDGLLLTLNFNSRSINTNQETIWVPISLDSIEFQPKYFTSIVNPGGVFLSLVTDIQQEPFLYSFKLDQNFPNPFNAETVINYTLPETHRVSIKIYNIRGEEVDQVLSKIMVAGNHEVSWDASNVASGIYFYRIQAGDFIQTRKMVLLK